jgi:hypothetical protein
MSDCISNLLEIIEPENSIYMTLRKRAAGIPEYEYFGPPDICYLIKEQKGGILSSSTRSG